MIAASERLARPRGPIRPGRWIWRLGGGVLMVALLLGMLTRSVTTKQGIDFQVSVHELPLYAKALGFVHRHLEYRALANRITRNLSTDEQRVLAVFDWTRHNIRPTPSGWPVVDDHILHIIIRGHGLDDQMADVFTTLATYADVPAFWHVYKRPELGGQFVLSYARLGGRWVVFDVWHGLIFRNAAGGLASAQELATDPSVSESAGGSLIVSGLPYARYFVGYTPPAIPDPLRSKLQMPVYRLGYVLGRWLRRTSQETARVDRR